MNFTNTKVYNFEGAFRGMRNPKNSWDKSDSVWGDTLEDTVIGIKDLELAQRLIKAGTEHAKFLRQIFVSVDINAPLYWWKEADQYRVGAVTNSTSTMHTLASNPITAECFEHDAMDRLNITDTIINLCEGLRQVYVDTHSTEVWRGLIQLLPESWLQLRTWTGNYAMLRNIYLQRQNHKLREWSVDFMVWVNTLPYAKELITYGIY